MQWMLLQHAPICTRVLTQLSCPVPSFAAQVGNHSLAYDHGWLCIPHCLAQGGTQTRRFMRCVLMRICLSSIWQQTDLHPTGLRTVRLQQLHAGMAAPALDALAALSHLRALDLP